MIAIHPDSVPLRLDPSGTIRVADTRITLDVLLGSLLRGVKPEEIVSEAWHPTLSLADVYGVLAYYHRHQAEIDDYLRGRREAADQMQVAIEASQPTFAEVKARLLARSDAHAPSVE